MSISEMEFDSFGVDDGREYEPDDEPVCTVPDAAIAIVWRAAMTCAINLVINRQNRLNEDDGPMPVLDEQGECIREMKQYHDIDDIYLEQVRSMLAFKEGPDG